MAFKAVGNKNVWVTRRLLHQTKRHFRRKTPCPRHDGPPKIQAGQQGVHQAAGPGPVGR
jgi:hypothetical protein